MKSEPQTCPLCGDDAEFYLVDYGNRKFFKCPQCSKFQISLRAEDRLAGVSNHFRESFSEKARLTPPDHLLVIVVKSPPAPEDVVGEYLPKSELPL